MALYVTLVPRSDPADERRNYGSPLMDGKVTEAGRSSAQHRSRSTRWRSLLIAAVRLVILIFAGTLAVLYLLQDRMIFPGTATQGSAEAIVHPRLGSEMIELPTPSGQRVAALYGPALFNDGRPVPDPRSRPALLYFYGNAMCLASAQYEFERFRRLGLNVMVPDYLGFGMSSGKASERGCRETAEVCLEALQARGFPSARIIAAGWSLGGAVAVDLASRHQVGGLIAFCTFTSTHDMARSIIPVPLPRMLFAHKFDSLSKLPSITCPMLLGHGRRDTIVPFPMFEQLRKAASGSVSTLILDDAGHNDFYDEGGTRIDEAIAHFVDSLAR
jgi:pimeloyl-ACP methyl ester carboxylesterase